MPHRGNCHKTENESSTKENKGNGKSKTRNFVHLI